MRAVQVSDEVEGIVNRHVAAGSASSGEECVEQAVCLYTEYLENNEAELIAAAEEGLEAIQRGEFATVESPEGAAAFRDGVWADAVRISARLREERSSGETTA